MRLRMRMQTNRKKIVGGKWKAGGGSLLAAAGGEDRTLDASEGQGEGFPMRFRRAGVASFTLVEILVVVTIIGILAGLAVPAISGALQSARKAKVTAMAQQIRTALAQFNTEYGYFPTSNISTNNGIGTTGPLLAQVLTGSDTNSNPRRIVFLEVPSDFTSGGSGDPSGGIVTPRNFYKTGQQPFSVAVDANYDGLITVTNGTTTANLRATTAVWYVDPKDSRKTIGTWR